MGNKLKFKYGRGYIEDYKNITFEMVSFPIIRRVYATLLANDIVPVHPINLPFQNSYVIYRKTKFKYGK